MKVRVYGFEWKLGMGITLPAFLDHLKRLPGPPANNRAVFAEENGDFYSGVVVTVKNMKAFCAWKEMESGYEISANQLEANTKMADFNFFILHRETFKGLYQHYHQSLSVNSFCSFSTRQYNYFRKKLIDADINDAGGEDVILQKDKNKILHKYKGSLSYSVLLKPDSFERCIDKMKSIGEFTVEFSSVSAEEQRCLPLSELSKRVSHRFVFGEHGNKAGIKDKIRETLRLGEPKKAAVHGLGEFGEEVYYKLFKDYATFHELEFNDIIDGVVINSNDLQESIRKSEVIELLLGISESSSVKPIICKKTI